MLETLILPDPVFFNLFFLPKNFRSLPLFPTWYSSQQSLYCGEDYIALPFPFSRVLSFFTVTIFPSPLYILTFFPNKLDNSPPLGGGIRKFIHPCKKSYRTLLTWYTCPLAWRRWGTGCGGPAVCPPCRGCSADWSAGSPTRPTYLPNISEIHKVPYNLIFFPTQIFIKSWFSSPEYTMAYIQTET